MKVILNKLFTLVKSNFNIFISQRCCKNFFITTIEQKLELRKANNGRKTLKNGLHSRRNHCSDLDIKAKRWIFFTLFLRIIWDTLILYFNSTIVTFIFTSKIIATILPYYDIFQTINSMLCYNFVLKYKNIVLYLNLRVDYSLEYEDLEKLYLESVLTSKK